jgi:hypothetical protein
MDTRENAKQILDEAINAVREDQPEKRTLDAASARAWNRLAQELNLPNAADPDFKIRGCADVEALLPAYKAGRLSNAHATIIRDHLGDCLNCQAKASRTANVRQWREQAAVKPKPAYTRRYAVAAALLVGVGLGAVYFRDSFLAPPDGYRATLTDTGGGQVFAISGKSQRPLKVGDQVAEKEWIRTGRGAHAMVQLRDGSMVEVKEHTLFTVAMNRADTIVHLDGGNIIVQAAKRRTGHLYVTDNNCLVGVTGTVFSVSEGIKGSRVSVMEGEVHVEHGKRQDVLHSGDQISTDPTMTPIAIRDDIAWSRNLDQHLKLLKQFADLKQQLATVQLPGLRYKSNLLNLVPENAIFFAAIPNYGQTLADANQILQSRIQQSPELRQWWEQTNGARANQAIDQAIEKIHTLSRYIGDEVVVYTYPAGDRSVAVTAIAEVRQPGLRQFVDSQLGDNQVPLHGQPQILITDKLVAISNDPQALSDLTTRAVNPQSNGFLKTDFYQRIAKSYRDGAGLLFTADLQQLKSHVSGGPPPQLFQQSGIDGARYLMFEQKEISGQVQSTALLSFTGARHGMASWLAAPAPMGSLNFISSNATVAVSVVVKNPTQLLDDLFGMIRTKNSNFDRELANFESSSGVRLRDDLAASLGSDITVALDGPALPTPSWKIAAEVNDPVHLEQSIERLAEVFKAKVEKSDLQGTPMYTLTIPGSGYEANYVFMDGYLVAGATRGLLSRTLRERDSGQSLARSHRFTSLLPTDGHANFSALIYHNLSRIAGALATAGSATNMLSADQQKALQELADNAKPTLLYAYGQEDQIQVAGNGMFGLDAFLSGAGLQQFFNVQAMLGTKRQ